MNYLIIIQARTGSSRLPKKMLKPFFEELTILEIIIRNLKKKFSKDQICVATSNLDQDEILCHLALKEEVLYFQGSETNVLDRFISCAKHFKAKNIIRVCADNPFLMPEFIFPLIENHNQYSLEYCSFQWPDKTPVMKSHIGIFAECMTLDFLQRISKKTKAPLYLEHVTNYLYDHSADFKHLFLALPDNIRDKHYYRLTVDTSEDFKLAQELYGKLRVHGMNVETLIEEIESDNKYIRHMKENILRNAK